MIQNFIFGILFFENITSGMKRFCICFDVSGDTTRVIFLRKSFAYMATSGYHVMSKEVENHNLRQLNF